MKERKIFDVNGTQLLAGDRVKIKKGEYEELRVVYTRPNSNSLWVYHKCETKKTSIPTLISRGFTVEKAIAWEEKAQDAPSEKPEPKERKDSDTGSKAFRPVDNSASRPAHGAHEIPCIQPPRGEATPRRTGPSPAEAERQLRGNQYVKAVEEETADLKWWVLTGVCVFVAAAVYCYVNYGMGF